MTGKSFLDYRKEQIKKHQKIHGQSDDPMASLISVELNLMDACNRVCLFCPHSDEKVYPNRYDWKMSLETTEELGRQLAAINYHGRISMSGYGEPMLAKDVYTHISTYRAALPDNPIEMNTNGDALSPDRITRLFEAGLSNIYINLYDGEHQIALMEQMFQEAGIDKFILRHHWSEEDSYGLFVNNRSGLVNPLDKAQDKACYYPFYKMFVDWNGDVLFCANDWGRNIIVGNIMETPVQDIWMSDAMKGIRLRLANRDRSQSPCNKCDVDGTLHSSVSFDLLMEYYNRAGQAS